MDENSRITIDPEVVFGKPHIRGTRVTVEQILGCLSQGWKEEHITEEFPHVNSEDIHAALRYSQEVLGRVHVMRSTEQTSISSKLAHA